MNNDCLHRVDGRGLLRTGLLLAAFVLGAPAGAAAVEQARNTLEWGALPALPEARPLEGAFVGVAGKVLVVAGGADTDIGPVPDHDGIKAWYGDVFALRPKAKTWMTNVGTIPPLAFGASVTTPHGLVCIGGADGSGASASVLLL